MEQWTDEQLVYAAQNNDEAAFSEIYRRYQKSLFYMAYRITNNREDAQDALQDTFLQVKRSIKDIKRPDYLKLWLNRIIAGKCRDIFRRNKTVSVDMDDNQMQMNYIEERKEFVPEKHIRFETDKEVVDYYIALLPYAQREAIVFAYFQNMTLQEIADILGESLNTIKSRIHLAKKTLRKHLSAYENREGVKLTFRSHSLEAALILALQEGFAKTDSTAAMGMPHHKMKASDKKWRNSTKRKLALYGLSGAIIFGGTGIYVYSRRQEAKKEETTLAGTVESDHVRFHEQEIRSDRTAYFLLVNWAMNEEQMKHKTAEEIAEYRPVYEYLKQHQGAYYQALKDSGLVTVLETYF